MARLQVELVPIGRKTPYPLIQHNGQHFVVADGEPSDEFRIKCRIVNPVSIQEYRFKVSVDGQDLGYTMTSNRQHNFEATFDGFMQSSAPITYKAFRFGTFKPSSSAQTVEHPDDIKAGRIEVQCEVVVAVGTLVPYATVPTNTGSETVHKKLPEGKKWFLQPGLKAEVGTTVTRSSGTWGTTKYAAVSTLEAFKLRYDTPENLKLRNILKPSIPEHLAILRSSKNERVAALHAPDAAPGGKQQQQQPQQPGVGSSSGQGRNKNNGRQAAVKPEGGKGGRAAKRNRDQQQRRQQQQQQQQKVKEQKQQQEPPGEAAAEEAPAIPKSATADTINLVDEEPAGPIRVGGRAVRNDELAVCDLCDSDDDEPSWQVHKKRAVEV